MSKDDLKWIIGLPSVCLIALVILISLGIKDVEYTKKIANQFYSHRESYKLLAFTDRNQLDGKLKGGGSFILGCGSININGSLSEKIVYKMVLITKTGLKPITITDDNCDIYLHYIDETSIPKIKISVTWVNTSEGKVKDLPLNYIYLIDKKSSDISFRVDIYIPEGSIIYDNSLDGY
jgi:hypothetical protein